MTVEDGAHFFGDWIVEIVVVGEHGVDGRDRARCRLTRALEQPRQHRKHRRGITLSGRRLARSEPDLALRPGHARERVHEQEHALAAIAKVLGDGRGAERGLEAQQRRRVRRGAYAHRATPALVVELRLEEVAHLAATLAHEADDDDVRIGEARDLPEQRRLADAGGSKHAEALSLAEREHAVDGADAGGQGLRLGGEIPKQFLPVKGRPLLFYTLEKFQGIADEIILVLPESHMDFWKELCRSANFESGAKLVEGGESRSQSVLNGLLSLNGDGVVAIHDAVRPLVSKNLINKLFEEAAIYGNAVPVVPIRESMRLRNEKESHSVNRSAYVAVQTPQCFIFQSIVKSYQNKGAGVFTDDASVFEHSGGVIHLVEGETTNIKITFKEDVAFAEALLNSIIL